MQLRQLIGWCRSNNRLPAGAGRQLKVWTAASPGPSLSIYALLHTTFAASKHWGAPQRLRSYP